VPATGWNFAGILNLAKNPRFNAKQIETFIAFMGDEEVVPSSQVSEIYPDVVEPVDASLLDSDIDPTPVSLLSDSLFRTETGVADVEDQEMMEVDHHCDNMSIDKVPSEPQFREPRPCNFVSDDEGESLEEVEDEDMYYETEDGGSYMALVDDDDHNAHDEDAYADDEDYGDKQSVGEEVYENEPRTGVTMYDYDKFGHLAAGVRRYRKKWSVLEQYRQVPERVRSMVLDRARKCIEDTE
jgi:hypothetical protein